MWIACGHQRPHANVTPSSFVAPNVPLRMCHEMRASQLPVVGSALKLHGHPHAQLQLWMYSASKFHLVGIDRTSFGPGLVIGPRLLNPAREPSSPTDSARSYRHVPFRSRNGRNGTGRARLAATAFHRPCCCGGRPCPRGRLGFHLDLPRPPDWSHGALPVAV